MTPTTRLPLVERLLETASGKEGYANAVFDVYMHLPKGKFFGDLEEAAALIEKQGALVAALVEALTPSGDTKGDYIGEFQFNHTVWDPDGEDEITHVVKVPWTTIKEIMHRIGERGNILAAKTLGERE